MFWGTVEGFTGDLQDLLTGMLQRRPEKRFDLGDIKANPWFIEGVNKFSM